MTKTTAPPTDRMLTRPEVEQRVGLSCSALYRLMERGEFPRPIRIGVRAVRWSESEIESWIASRPRAGGHTPWYPPAAAEPQQG